MDLLKSLYSSFVRKIRSTKTQQPKIFQLNIDCFDEIFEYLSVKDLHSFGQTCGRMNKVAGEYFKRNYRSAKKHYNYSHGKNGIICKTYSAYFVDRYRHLIEINGFINFMPYVIFYDDNKKLKKYSFESINHICLKSWRPINHKKVKWLVKLLPQLNILHILRCWVDGDLYELILKHCKNNLKEFHFECSNTGIHRIGKLNWLLHEYPKLECLNLSPILLQPSEVLRIEELREFFVCNPYLQRFATDVNIFLDNSDIFLSSNAKLDLLLIRGNDRLFTTNSIRLLKLLNQLHEQGFYRRLYIHNGESFVDSYYEFLALVKGLEILHFSKFRKSFNLVQLTNLREIIVRFGSLDMDEKDLEILANGLTSLNRLWINGYDVHMNVDVIRPFIRRSLNLNKIKFVHLNPKILNLPMLNEERANLVGAQKITLYVRGDVFLHNKWTTRNGDMNMSFIEVRRYDSIYWNHSGFSPKIT